MGTRNEDAERNFRGWKRKQGERRGKREGGTQEGWTNGWPRLATPMPSTKARPKMADASRARGARVIVLNSAYARYTPSFRLFSTHPVANNPSTCGHAPLCESPGSPDHPLSRSVAFPLRPSIPPSPGAEEFIHGALFAGQSAPKSAQLQDNIPRTPYRSNGGCWLNRNDLTVGWTVVFFCFRFPELLRIVLRPVTPSTAWRYVRNRLDRSSRCSHPSVLTFLGRRTSSESAAHSIRELFIHYVRRNTHPSPSPLCSLSRVSIVNCERFVECERIVTSDRCDASDRELNRSARVKSSRVRVIVCIMRTGPRSLRTSVAKSVD